MIFCGVVGGTAGDASGCNMSWGLRHVRWGAFSFAVSTTGPGTRRGRYYTTARGGSRVGHVVYGRFDSRYFVELLRVVIIVPRAPNKTVLPQRFVRVVGDRKEG